MQHSFVILGFLFPSDQDSPEAIHPTVRPLTDPATSLEPRGFLQQPLFFSPRADVSGKPKLFQQIANLTVVVTLVQAHTLLRAARRSRPRDRNRLNRFAQQFEVVDVGSGDRQTDRHACGIRQQAALGAAFGPVCGVRTGFSPRPRGPWSSRRRRSASASRDASTRRIPSTPGTTYARRDRRPPTPEIDRGRSKTDRYRSRSVHSIGSRFEVQTGCRSNKRGRVYAADPRRRDGCLLAPAAAVRPSPTVHPIPRNVKPSWPCRSLHAHDRPPMVVSAKMELFG